MNVLLIQSDQQRWDALGVNSGGLVQTPNLDGLARRGVNFTACYANSPLCGPSRGSSVTGRWSHDIGCYGNATSFDGRVPTVAHCLRDHGIRATDIGRMDFAKGCDHGFTAVHEHPRQNLDPGEFFRTPMAQRIGGYRSIVWDPAVYDDNWPHKPIHEIESWLDTHAKDREPWHLFANFILPHPPFYVPRVYVDRYHTTPVPAPAVADHEWTAPHPAVAAHRHHWNVETPFPNDDCRYKRKIYYAMTSWLDDMVGRILNKLDQLGIRDNTLILFTSDHGEHLGDHGLWSKGSFYDPACRVPLIASGPGLPTGETVMTPVSLIDLAPTILDAFDLDAPTAMQGHSLLPVARQESSRHPGVVFGTYHGHDAVSGQFMVRTDRHKYIHHVGLQPQLFDLKTDPDETEDLGQHPAHAETVRELEKQLREVFDPEAIDAAVRADQETRFRQWRDALGPTQAEATLREIYGEDPYADLAARHS